MKLLSTAWLLFVATTARAQGNYTGPDSAYLLKLVLALLVVLAIIVVLARVVRSIHGLKTGQNDKLRVLSVVALGGRERLMWVRAGETELLLGVSSAGISRLHEFDGTAAAQDPRE